MSLSQGTDTATVTTAESTATSSEPRPASTVRPARVHRRPARYLEQVLAWRPSQACVRHISCCPACCNVAAVSCHLESGCRARVCCLQCFVDCEMSRSSDVRTADDYTAAGDLPPSASGGDETGAIAPFVHPRAGTKGFHEPEVHFMPNSVPRMRFFTQAPHSPTI